ncbi:MAG: ATP-binding response regulator, partial [Caulobacteraceae bacterium]
NLRIRVRDTGIGVAPDKLAHLFSKFYQTDSSNTRRFGGTGLGLAICRELCDLMGGSITAESVEGEGSTFSVILPIKQIRQKAAVDAFSTPGSTVGDPAFAEVISTSNLALEILVAEDNLSNQLVLRALLQAFDITPTIVGNGALAVQACEAKRYDLVLMDIQMPEMDGVTATRLIRAAEARNDLPRTPIIALSANAMSHQIREYLAADMDGHIPKPIDITQLAALISGLEPAAACTAP